MIAKSRNELAAWDSYLDKCLLGMDTEFQKIFNVGSLKGKSMIEIEKTLKMMSITGPLKDNILRIAEIKYERSPIQADLKDLQELVSAQDQGLTAPQSFFMAKRIWDRIKAESDENHFLKKLLEVLVALRVGNDAWAKRALGEATFIDPYQFALEINSAAIEANALSALRENIAKAVTILAKEMKDEPIVAMYINTLAGQTNDELILKARDDLGFRWSLIDIRNLIGDRLVGSSYPHVWFVALSGRTTQNEIDNYFSKALDVQKIEKWPWYKFWLFRTYFPNETKLREVIYSKLEQLSGSKSDHKKLLLVQMADNPTVKRELKGRVSDYSKPTFQLKREFYRSLFYEGTAPYFALFQLWSMGDISDEGLLWLAI